MKFRPCIDLHQGVVKQIVGATLKDGADEAPKENFASSLGAAEYARKYRADGIRGGHVIMLGGGNEQAAKEALAAFPQGLQVGGGVNADNAEEWIAAGASHVIVTSFVFKDGKINMDNLKLLRDKVGAKRLVLDLSCRKRPGGAEAAGSSDGKRTREEREDDGGAFFVVTDRWQKFTDFAVTEANLKLLAEYCDEFLVHGVDVEGLQQGVIEDLVEKLGAWSPIPVTYAGGARTIADLELVRQLGAGKVDLTIGSALDIFGGELLYDEVVMWHYAHLHAPAELEALRKADPKAALRSQLAKAALNAKLMAADAAQMFRLTLELPGQDPK